MIESYPQHPVRVFAASVGSGVELVYIVPPGCYLTLTGMSVVFRGADTSSFGTCTLTMGGIIVFALGQASVGPDWFWLPSPPLVAHDSEQVLLDTEGEGETFDVMVMGFLTVKAGAIT